MAFTDSGKKAGTAGSAKPPQQSQDKKKRNVPSFRWFPKVIVPLIFALILAAAVTIAKQIDYARQWKTVSDWFGQIFYEDAGTTEAEQTPEETEVSVFPTMAGSSAALSMGETAATDRVQVTLDSVGFSDVIAFRFGNWLKPADKGGISAGDGSTFVCFTFTVENFSDVCVDNTELCNVTVDYNGVRYSGAEYGFEAQETFSTNEADSAESVSSSLAPQNSREYYGYIACPAEVKTNRDVNLLVNFLLPGSDGEEEFSYLCRCGGKSTGEETTIVELLQTLTENLTYIREHVGETNASGSRAFDPEVIRLTRNGLDGINEVYVNENLPETAARLPMIQKNLKSICDKLEVMSISNSAGNVAKIRSLASQTIAIIQGLLDSELEEYAGS